MLVLSRKIGERILIGDGIELTVVQVRGDRVKLGLTAPPEVSILREERYIQDQVNGRRRLDRTLGTKAAAVAAPTWLPSPSASFERLVRSNLTTRVFSIRALVV